MVNETQRKLISQSANLGGRSTQLTRPAAAAVRGLSMLLPRALVTPRPGLFWGSNFHDVQNYPNRDGTRSPCGWGSGSHHYPQWPGRWAVHAAAPHMPAPAPPVQRAMRSKARALAGRAVSGLR